MTNNSIARIQRLLPDDSFIKIYISFVVNMEYIRKISDGRIELYNSEVSLPVSRKYIKELKRRFTEFKEIKVNTRNRDSRPKKY